MSDPFDLPDDPQVDDTTLAGRDLRWLGAAVDGS